MLVFRCLSVFATQGVHNDVIYKGYWKDIHKSIEEEKNLHLLKMKKKKKRLTNKCPLERTIFPHQKSVSYFFLSCWARGSFFSLSNKLFVSHFNNWNVAMNLITSIILEILYILNCIIAVYLIFVLRKFW